MSKSLVMIFVLLFCKSVFANYQNLVEFETCSLYIPNGYQLTVDSKYRKSYMSLGVWSSIMVSGYVDMDAPDRELTNIQKINGLVFEEYRLFKKKYITNDQFYQKSYRVYDDRTLITFANVDRAFVMDLINSCE